VASKNAKGRTFRKIWFDGSEIRLEWAAKDGDTASQTVSWKCQDPPLGKFRDAIQSFKPFATQLLGLPKAWDNCVVRSLTLTDKEDGTRGLNVTLVRAIPAARNQTVPITTPHLETAPDGHTASMRGFLTSEVHELIETIEEYAEEYHGGAREKQLTLADSKNADDFDEAAAHAERTSTRRPRAKKTGSYKQTDIEESEE
jgi:hypothetical protein